MRWLRWREASSAVRARASSAGLGGGIVVQWAGIPFLAASKRSWIVAPVPRPVGTSTLACPGWQCQACHTAPTKFFGLVPSLSFRRDANGVLVCPEHEPVLRTRSAENPTQVAKHLIVMEVSQYAARKLGKGDEVVGIEVQCLVMRPDKSNLLVPWWLRPSSLC